MSSSLKALGRFSENPHLHHRLRPRDGFFGDAGPSLPAKITAFMVDQWERAYRHSPTRALVLRHNSTLAVIYLILGQKAAI